MPSTELATTPTLPSAGSALAFVRGDPGALPVVVFHMAARAAIIGAGLYVAGTRRNIVRTALVSSMAIETFVLCWAVYQNTRPPPAP